MHAPYGMADMSVRVVANHTDLCALESDWHRLSGSVPFRSFQWHQRWCKHFSPDDSLMILAVYDQRECGQETCIGIAPLFVKRILGIGRVAQFIGSGAVASDRQSFFASPNCSQLVGHAIARWFTSDQNRLADLMQLDGIDPDCEVFTAFVAATEQFDCSLVDRSSLHTWRIDLPNSMDDYLAMLSKPCRRKVRTALKRFDSGELIVSIAEDSNSFDRNWQHFTRLHQQRRQSLGQKGCFANEAFSDFLHDVAREFFAAGRLDLICVSNDQSALASEVCFRDSSCCYAYQLGIDPNALKQSPGWLINTAAIRHAIELGLDHFDLCRGDSSYKRQLGAKPNVCQRLRIAQPSLRSQVLNRAITQVTAVRNWCQLALNVSAVPS